MSLELSPRQSATVAAAITFLSGAVIFALALGVFWLFARFLAVFSSVFMPLFVAMILAFVVRPIYVYLHEKRRLGPVPSVTLVFVTILLPVVLVAWFLVGLVLSQVPEIASRLPDLMERARVEVASDWPRFKEVWDEHGLGERTREFAQEQAGAIWQSFKRIVTSAASAGASAFGTLAAGLSWFVLPVYLAFFLMAPPLPEDLEAHMPFLKKETRDDVLYLVQEFFNILVSFFRGQLIVALAQGLLFAAGFAIVGLQYGFVIGILLGFLNVIPYLGSMIGLAVALPLALFQPDGGALKLLLVLGVFALVQTIEGYVLTPKIMGDRTGLHPLAIIVAIFFWGTAFDGLAGMILAIPLTAFFVVFWRLVRTKYMAEIV